LLYFEPQELAFLRLKYFKEGKMMSLINISNLTFAYEGSYDNIFENVSFQIDTDWKLGFTGRNGRGKTTFLNLLLGKYEYRGNISASVVFQYFPHNAADKSIETRAVIEEICPSCQDWELMRELSLLDVNENVLNRPFETLSNGEQTKVLLASLFLSENNFLLIDEPTNHLDIAGRGVVSRYLNGKSGFILVSHDRAFLDGCIDHILSINRANIDLQRGNFSSWLANKERQDSFESAENEKLKKDIKRLKQAAKQSGSWADKAESTKIGKGSAGIEKFIDNRAYIGEKSRRMQQRRKNLERRQLSAIEEKSELLKNIERLDSLKITQMPYHKQRYLSLSGVSIYYGANNVCKNISFEIGRGDRIAMHGRNGSGKSSILKLICGEEIYYTGEFALGSGLHISYVSQDTSDLRGSLTQYALESGIDESLFKAILRKLDFSRVQFEKDMKDFSGGQKKKTLLARSLCEKSHLLIWDEPLNFIDVLSRMQIEELLLEYAPTILFVEHDRIFCDKIATKRVTLI
jgi:lincosamide and streptogramin A transport system ATP-binding/permease protein